jgi:hypothetical protein
VAEPAVWVALPRIDARAILTVTAITAHGKHGGWAPWPIGVGPMVTGYQVSFHAERPPRSR